MSKVVAFHLALVAAMATAVAIAGVEGGLALSAGWGLARLAAHLDSENQSHTRKGE